MITVVGGTGRLGRLVSARLVSEGHAVRVVGRSTPSSLGPGRRVHRCRRPGPVHPAARGRRAPTSSSAPRTAWTPTPESLPLRSTATATGHSSPPPGRWAPTSCSSRSSGRDPGHPLELFRMKASAEAFLRGACAGSAPGLDRRAGQHPSRRCGSTLPSTAGRSGVPKVLGPGRNAMNFVSVADVAVAVARAATDPTLRGRVIEVAVRTSPRRPSRLSSRRPDADRPTSRQRQCGPSARCFAPSAPVWPGWLARPSPWSGFPCAPTPRWRTRSTLGCP